MHGEVTDMAATKRIAGLQILIIHAVGLLAAPAQAGETKALHYDEQSASTATYFAAISNLANAIMFSGLGEKLVVSPYERDDWLRRAG